MDAFEKHLSDLKFQEPPVDLREKCLAPLHTLSAPVPECRTSRIASCWTTWLWPHPKVWSGLAAVWLLCFWLNHWSSPLPNYSRGNIATNQSDLEFQTISVLHYSLAMDLENLDDILEPQTPPKETPEEAIRPNAFIHRVRPLECARLDAALDTIRQRNGERSPGAGRNQKQNEMKAMG